MHPIEGQPTTTEKPDRSGPKGFTAEIRLNEVAEHHKKIVRNALNAGATLEAVQRHNNNHYLVSSEFYKALANIRAKLLQSASRRTQQPYFGGDLNKDKTAVTRERRDQIEYKPQPPGNGHIVDGASDESDEDRRQRFRDDLLERLGLSSEALAGREVPSEAREAAARLKRELRARPDLRRALESIEQKYKRSLNEATLALKPKFAGDKQALDLLEEARQDISRVVLDLMLPSERKLFGELIKEANGDAELVRQLYALRDNHANGSG